MGSPEETIAAAAADVAVTPGGAFEELTGSLQGWKRKLSTKKGGTPKKKDITFVAPDGEEIKTKRQLEKYLKAHPGPLTSSDFEWGVPAVEAVTPPENRRRSARLNSRGRISTEGIDDDIEPKQPVLKRSRKSRENGKDENDAAGKDEADIKAATEDGIDIPSDQSLDKTEKENGEDNGEIKGMDVDVPKMEAPAIEKSKDVTAKTLTNKPEDGKVVSEGINGEKPLDTLTEPSLMDATESKVENGAEGNGDAGKPNGEATEKTKEAGIPPPQGIHALIGEVPKPLGVEVASAPEAVI